MASGNVTDETKVQTFVHNTQNQHVKDLRPTLSTVVEG